MLVYKEACLVNLVRASGAVIVNQRYCSRSLRTENRPRRTAQSQRERLVPFCVRIINYQD